MLLRFLPGCAYLVVCLSAAPTLSSAASPGRAWTLPAPLSLPGWDFVSTPHFLVDSTGVPRLHAVAARSTGSSLTTEVFGLRWTGQDWTPAQQLGHQLSDLGFVAQPPRSNLVLSWDLRPIPGASDAVRYLILGDLDGPSADSVAIINTVSQRAAAVSEAHRWVIVNNAGTLELHTRPNAPNTKWRTFIVTGGPGLVTITCVTDSIALFAWSTKGGTIRWGIAYPDTFEIGGTLSPFAEGPGAWTSRDGRVWLGWGEYGDQVKLSEFRQGVWTSPLSLSCDLVTPEPRSSLGASLGGFDGSFPIVASVVSSTSGYRSCVSVPSPPTYLLADELPGSPYKSTVTSDRNGDVWLASAPGPGQTTVWAHTYCKATIMSTAIQGNTEAREVRWTISEPAPGSWWAVERARPQGDFDEVARVQAAASTQASWTDTSVAYEPLRYRIRRENIDERYVVFGDPVLWDYPTAAEVSVSSVAVEGGSVRLEWFGVGAGNLIATVERRGVNGGWHTVGDAQRRSRDTLVFEDSSVARGNRYAYRLAYILDGSETFTSEVWVDVPRARFSLSGFSPNPSAGAAVISFSLPASGDAQVEVLDVSGRRLARQRLKGLPAGDHVVDLRKSLPPGLYVIRLRFGDQELVARGVVVR